MSRSAIFRCPTLTLYPPSHFATAFTSFQTMDHTEPLLLTLDSHSIHHQSHSFISSHHHHHHHHHQYTSQYQHGSPPVSEEAASCSSASPNALYIHTSPEYATYGIGPTSAQHSYWDVNAWDTSGVSSYAGEPSDQAASSSLYSHHFSPYATSPPLHSENCTSLNAADHHHLSQYHHAHQLELSRSQSLHHSFSQHDRPPLLHHQEPHLTAPHQQLIHQLDYVEYNCEGGGGGGGGGGAKYAGSSLGHASFRNLNSNEGAVSSNNSSNSNNNNNNSTSSSSNLPGGVPVRSVSSNVTGSVSNRVGRGNKLAPVNPSKKERRRTLSINCAFSNLRECIPNVPVDTKLSKIKTLRLATSYIAYLMNLLNDSDNSENGSVLKGKEGFKVDLQRFKRSSRSASAAAIAAAVAASLSSTSSSSSSSSSASSSSSCVPLTSTTYRNQSSSKMAVRGGNMLTIGMGTGTNNCTTRKGTFNLTSTMVTSSMCGSEVAAGVANCGSLSTSSSVVYSSSSTCGNISKGGSTSSVTGGAKGRTGWPEHVWELELKNGTGDTSVGALVACGVGSTSCINSSSSSDESGILSNIG